MYVVLLQLRITSHILEQTNRKNISSKAKLHAYIKVKDNVYTEVYVKYCQNRRKNIILIPMLYTNVLDQLPLHIETGTFRNKQPEDIVYANVVNVEFNVIMSNEESLFI